MAAKRLTENVANNERVSGVCTKRREIPRRRLRGSGVEITARSGAIIMSYTVVMSGVSLSKHTPCNRDTFGLREAAGLCKLSLLNIESHQPRSSVGALHNECCQATFNVRYEHFLGGFFEAVERIV